MNKNKIKHIFFDLDNTLWDHDGNSEVVLSKMFSELEIHSKHKLSFEQWHPVFLEINERLWGDLRDGKISKQELRETRFVEPFVHLGVKDKQLGGIFDKQYLDRMKKMTGLVTGAVSLLSYLQSKYSIHVITNGFSEVSGSKVANSALRQFIETLTCADEVKVRKPHPKIFAHALQQAQARPEESVLVGDDWVADVVGATQNGMQAIFFNPHQKKHSMQGVPNVAQLLDIKELL